MKCTDCIKPFHLPSRGRRDICQSCWELRVKTISAVKDGSMTIAAFKEIQAAMARGEGQKAMLLAINSDLYEI